MSPVQGLDKVANHQAQGDKKNQPQKRPDQSLPQYY